VSALIVAIDGPAGSGKSSVARLVATRLQLPHLDTGGFYRAATLMALRHDIDPKDAVGIVNAMEGIEVTSRDGLTVIDDEIVERAIRGPEVTAAVSAVSAHPEVREMLVQKQRKWVMDRGGSAVVEGRDIGTVVFPEAQLKIFLTADAMERARRRAREFGEDPAKHLEAIERRDAYDKSRNISPLVAAPDAIVVDTTEMSISEVVQTIVGLAESLQV
jgi:cytidylate kinase